MGNGMTDVTLFPFCFFTLHLNFSDGVSHPPKVIFPPVCHTSPAVLLPEPLQGVFIDVQLGGQDIHEYIDLHRQLEKQPGDASLAVLDRSFQGCTSAGGSTSTASLADRYPA